MPEITAHLKMNYEGIIYVVNRFNKAAEWRRKELSLAEDPFTAVSFTDNEEFIFQVQIYKSFFKLYKGLKADLSSIKYLAKQYDGGFNQYNLEAQIVQHEHIQSLQNKILLMLFETIELPATISIQETYNDGELNQAEKHGQILNALPRRIRRALPDPLKWHASPFESSNWEEFKEDTRFSMDEKISRINPFE